MLPVSVYGNLYEEQNFISSCRVPGDEFKVPESSSDLAGATLHRTDSLGTEQNG